MSTYCPSCGLNQPTEERVAGSRRQWRCAVCGLVFKEEAAPEQVLGRVPLQLVSPAELRAAADKAAAEKASAAAAAAAAKARPAAAAPAAAAEKPALPSWQNGDGIEITGMPTGEFVIEMNGQEIVAGRPRSPAPAPAPAPSAEAVAPAAILGALFGRVIVAEDTALLREILKDALVQNGVSKQVRGCANGEEFLQACAETLASGSRLDLAILDVEMPVLGGYQAAIALRAVERGLRAPPTPIVFFTAYACDDTFRRVLDHCQPARYLNKGADTSPPRIASRLVQVLANLKQ